MCKSNSDSVKKGYISKFSFFYDNGSSFWSDDFSLHFLIPIFAIPTGF